MDTLTFTADLQEAPYVPDVHDHEAATREEYGWDTYRFLKEEPDEEPPFHYHPCA